MWWKSKSAYQLDAREVVLRARELGLPDAESIFGGGELPSHEDIMATLPRLVENLRSQITATERENREWWLWIVAVLSALASVISAAAAWRAVLWSK